MHRKGVRRDSRRHAHKLVSLVPSVGGHEGLPQLFQCFLDRLLMSTANGHECICYRIYCQSILTRSEEEAAFAKPIWPERTAHLAPPVRKGSHNVPSLEIVAITVLCDGFAMAFSSGVVPQRAAMA